MDIKYVPYEEKYKSALCNMINGLYMEDPEGESMSDEKIEGTIRQAEGHPERLIIHMMVDGDGKAVGYGIIQMLWSNEWGGLTANIDEMYVAKEARNNGVATDYIKKLPSLVPGINRVTLEVTPSNDDALKLYERIGFRLAENRVCEMIIQVSKA